MTQKDPVLEAIAKLVAITEQQEKDIVTLKHELSLIEKRMNKLMKDHEMKLRHVDRQVRTGRNSKRW